MSVASSRSVFVLTVAVAVLVAAAGLAWACTTQAYMNPVRPQSGESGDVVEVSGGDFRDGEVVVYWGGEENGREIARRHGPDFSFRYTIPNEEADTYYLEAVAYNDDGSVAGSGSASFTIKDPNGSSDGQQEDSRQDSQTRNRTTVSDASQDGQPGGERGQTRSTASGGDRSGESGRTQSSVSGGDSTQSRESASGGEPTSADRAEPAPSPSGDRDAAPSSQPQPDASTASERDPGRQSVDGRASQPAPSEAQPQPDASSREHVSSDPGAPGDGEGRQDGQAQPATGGDESRDEPAPSSSGRSRDEASASAVAPEVVEESEAAPEPQATASEEANGDESASRHPSQRSAAGDLWSGFDVSGDSPSLTPDAGAAVDDGQAGSSLAVGVALLGLGGMTLLSGGLAAALRRRRVPAEAGAGRR